MRTFCTVTVSDFGIMRLTLNFGVPPLMDFASQRFAYDQRVSLPVMTFKGFTGLFDISVVLHKFRNMLVIAGRLSLSGTSVGFPCGFVTSPPRMSLNCFFPSIVVMAVTPRTLCS